MKRILKREYAQSFLNTRKFKGYITLLHTIKVTEPLHVSYGKKKVWIVDNGFALTISMEANHSVTTMFNANRDIVLLPSGEMIEKDAEELENTLVNKVINKSLYDLAWNEFNKIKKLINTGTFDLPKLSNRHKKIIFEQLK